MNLKRFAKRLLVGLPIAVIAAQFVPVDRANPPVETDVPAPPDAHAVLRRACYDCHSNETVWPWYSRVAPVSWLVARDVGEGREHVNFSTWNRLDGQARQKAMREIWEQIEDGEMPLWFYLPLHPEARLSEADKSAVAAWARPSGEAAQKR